MKNRTYKNVKLGANVEIGDFVIIGVPPHGAYDGEHETIIGDNAIIRSHSVIYAGNVIGDNFQSGHGVMLREFNKIGANVSIGTGTVVEHHVTIENGVRIHSQVFIPEYSRLEEGSWLGPNVVLTNAKYPLSPNVKNELKGVIIKRNAKVGANSTLLPGIVVGENSLIGAGSMVVKDVLENTVVVGNPAKIINDISKLPYKHRNLKEP